MLGPSQPSRLRLLVVRDVDTHTASQLAETYVPLDPSIDLCVVCGPFTHRELVTREEEAVSEGDMAAVLAQLENIVCRVCYLPSQAHDPNRALTQQLHLTPNSVCMHARAMLLTHTLYICGYSAEGGEATSDSHKTDSDDEVPGNSATVQTVQELITHAQTLAESGVVVLDNFNKSSLVQLLTPAQTDTSIDQPNQHVCLCICGTDSSSPETIEGLQSEHFPLTPDRPTVCRTPSLRQTGRYAIVELTCTENDRTCWQVSNITFAALPTGTGCSWPRHRLHTPMKDLRRPSM